MVNLRAEASGSNKRHFFFMRPSSCLILLPLINSSKNYLDYCCKAQFIFVGIV